ncbi:hypothetical protein GH714_010072 [Hevea brasiliensis]|uniref:tRNA (adenine(58)-N(1))-methyltransferase n=1 Tax=Hevea brasiliensis TaxID=3981 RepID=A0A6A6M484_HEVBR|nr:hypothetical protein GH714_010072 [Hevea brasiliensis]
MAIWLSSTGLESLLDPKCLLLSNKGGFVYLLAPTPELWTLVLSHRTQILYIADISFVITYLEIVPGCLVLESGTGSGSLTTSLARAVAPTGHVYTFDFHEQRAALAREDFERTGVSSLVTFGVRDIQGEGFPDEYSGLADSVFLDLPQPWLVLKVYPFPATVSAFQSGCGTVMIIIMWALNLYHRPKLTSSQLTAILPLAVIHTLGNLLMNVSLGKVAVSFTHTIKAVEPFFTVLFAALFLGERPYFWALSSLVPIVCGVALASFTEASFNWIGFCSAMASNVTNQSRNVLSKKFMVDKEEKLDNINLFSVITIISFILLVPTAIFLDGYKFTPSYLQSAANQGLNVRELCLRSLLTGFCFHSYQQVSYMILEMVNPVTHAVGNCVKRVVVIVSSVIFFQTPISPINSLASNLALTPVSFSISPHLLILSVFGLALPVPTVTQLEQSLHDLITMNETLSCKEPPLELLSEANSGLRIAENKLVARVVGLRKYNPWVLKSTVSKIWKLSSECSVKRGSDGCFIFGFEDCQVIQMVCDEGPWLIDNNLVIFKRWPIDKSVEEIDFSRDGFWIQIHGCLRIPGMMRVLDGLEVCLKG